MEQNGTQSVDDQAVQWFVLLRDEDATAEDRRAFAHWLAFDPTHETAWRSVERMWGGLDALAPEVARQRRKPRRNSRLKRGAAVALLLAAIGIGWQMAPTGLFADYRTAIGERRMIVLQDGSQVDLGAASALDVSFSTGERRVRLLTGEAFFTVTKDAARPFVVAAENGEVKVLGTAFDVKIADGVAVAVAHNAVQVSAQPPDRPGDAPVVVKQGQIVRYDSAGISAVDTADLESIQAWRHGQLVFRDVPLDTVLTELQRYRSGRIALIGGALGQRRVTAVFDATKTEQALDTIAESLSLRVYRAGGLLTVIIPNDSAEKTPVGD
ncbi:FecR family protein [Nitrobacter winogradskyi]|uniref:Histidine kinase n=2 Tax=Nitrobacter winogradskyi TaxID=913 RepID=A0A4Y3WF09_NITWI|nr:FecR family protein [Nitrobacter winogradskyi]MCP2001171.1 transmembrane sensor [Nitrobacter winogradskyi]GEC17474.1 histidine kinase [Nitrobacter winogradskyi]